MRDIHDLYMCNESVHELQYVNTNSLVGIPNILHTCYSSTNTRANNIIGCLIVRVLYFLHACYSLHKHILTFTRVLCSSINTRVSSNIGM